MTHRPLNTERLAERQKAREAERAASGSGKWLNLKEGGKYLLYICGPSREDDDINYIEFTNCYGLGSDGKKRGVSLDTARNPLLLDERVQDFLTERGVSSDGPCPLIEEWEKRKEDGDKKGADDIKPGTRFVFNVVPLGFSSDLNAKEWGAAPNNGELCKMECGATVWEGIVDVINQAGDITNPEEATLVIISKTGQKMKTKYKVVADMKTTKKPMDLSDEIKAQLEEGLVAGADHDLYKTFADMVKPRDALEAILAGVDTDDDDDDEEDTGKGKKKAAAADEDEDEAPPPKRTGRGTTKPAEEEEEAAEEEEPAEEEAAEEEEAPPPPKKTATTGKGTATAKGAAGAATSGKGAATSGKASAKPKADEAEEDDDTAALERELAKRKAGKK